MHFAPLRQVGHFHADRPHFRDLASLLRGLPLLSSFLQFLNLAARYYLEAVGLIPNHESASLLI